MSFLRLVVALLLVSSCGRQTGGESSSFIESGYVFQDDDRVILRNWEGIHESKPLLKIVRITSGFQKYCTGVLVGKDLVLTNAHCIDNAVSGNEIVKSIMVYSRFNYGTWRRSSYVTELIAGSIEPVLNHSDWALLRIRDSLGEEFGYFGYLGETTLDYLRDNNEVIMAGYSGDINGGNNLSIHEGCHINHMDFWGHLRHDCDMSAGASGSPLFQCGESDCRIVGLNNAYSGEESDPIQQDEYSFGVSNMAVNTSRFSRAINDWRKDDPTLPATAIRRN